MDAIALARSWAIVVAMSEHERSDLTERFLRLSKGGPPMSQQHVSSALDLLAKAREQEGDDGRRSELGQIVEALEALTKNYAASANVMPNIPEVARMRRGEGGEVVETLPVTEADVVADPELADSNFAGDGLPSGSAARRPSADGRLLPDQPSAGGLQLDGISKSSKSSNEARIRVRVRR